MTEKFVARREDHEGMEGLAGRLLARLEAGERISEGTRRQLMAALAAAPGPSPHLPPRPAEVPEVPEESPAPGPHAKSTETRAEAARQVTAQWNAVAHLWQASRSLDPRAQESRRSAFYEQIARALGVDPSEARHVDDCCCALRYRGVTWVLPYPGDPFFGVIERFYRNLGPNRNGPVRSLRSAGYIVPESNIQGPMYLADYERNAVAGELETA